MGARSDKKELFGIHIQLHVSGKIGWGNWHGRVHYDTTCSADSLFCEYHWCKNP
jgi:hypothetical protein